ncbi:EF-hand domain-containing protein [Rubripirellula lacrimiformis]|nr:EF-hand domain-containing protein [Rubripirellula lacrimiformis]
MNTRTLTFLVLTLSASITALAQPPFGGGDRGGDRGGRGGPPGGGDRGGGGFPGGGDRGGGGGRGGPPGGDRGSRGGFDPSSIMDRLDANKNGVLDPDEQQGPAQFLIGRMQQSDPSIKPGKPIPISKIKDAFEKMRGGGDSSSRGGSSNDGRSAADEALIPELLVPGFGEEVEASLLMGFGPKAEMLSVPVTDADRKEASETMRRYDRNRNGMVDKEEVSSRFSGNPMDFDRNKDGKLSLDELAVRYARRRQGEEDAKKSKRDDRRGRKEEGSGEIVDVYNGRNSYRVTSGRSKPEGLPGYFTDLDANSDGQVTMAEFATDWNDETVRRFFDSDFNRDGVITADESLRAVEEGPASQMSSGSVASTSSSAASSGSSSSDSASPAAPVAGGKADPKYVKLVARIVSRYDKNNDDALTPSEWESMLMSPAAADANRDGKITIEEYALWMQSKQPR